MKRTIAFLISFTLSFLFFFSSTAMAEEVQVAIPEVTSQSIQLPPVKVNSAFFLTPKPEIKIPVLEEIFTRKKKFLGLETCTQTTTPECIYDPVSNSRGYWVGFEPDRFCESCPT